MALYCTNLRSYLRPEGTNTVWVEFDFQGDKAEQFEIEVYVRSYVKQTWTFLKAWTSPKAKYKGSYKTYFTINSTIEEGSKANPVESYYFRVKPIAESYTYTEYDAEGTATTKTVPWFEGGWASSETYVAPSYNAYKQSVAAEFAKCEAFRENARMAYWEVQTLSPTPANKTAITKAYKAVQDNAGSCTTSANKVISTLSGRGYTVKTSYEMKWATSYKTDVASYLAYAKRVYDQLDKTTADKQKEALAYRATADTAWDSAGKQWEKAKSAAANKNDSAASSYYDNAATYYWKAAQNYGWAYEITESSYDLKWQNESAYWWNKAYTNAGYSLSNSQWTEQNLKAMGSKPSAPTVQVAQVGSDGHIRVTVRSSDRWSNRIVLQRSVNGGAWGTIKTFTRTVPKNGAAWQDQVWTDEYAWDGNSYRYSAYVVRTVIPVGPASAWSANASVTNRPSPPSNLQAVRLSNDSIQVSWVPEGHVGGEYVVCYSNVEGKDKNGNVVNPWVGGVAESKISKMTVPSGRTSVQLTGLAQGRWYFRLYRRNSGGESKWATTYNGGATVNVLLSNRASQLIAPQAVKASLVAATSVRITWADVSPIEDGASYVIEYTTNKRAWADNITDEIRSVKYGGADGKRYTVTGLSKGKRYYFAVGKVRGTERVWGKVSYECRTSDTTAFADVPAVYSEGVTVPSGLAVEAVAGTDYTDARLTWTDAQGAAEEYEIHYTNVSGALAADDMGVINVETLGTYTSNDLKTYTVKNLTPGHWAFRVRKLSGESVSYWSSTVTLDVLPSGGAMAAPAGLFAEAVSNGIRLTWTDVQEAGAQYEVWSTTDTNAYATNAMGHVTITGLGELASQGDNLWTYTLTDLSRGMAYMLRVRKNLGESFTWATTLTGHQSAMAETEAMVELSASASGSVSVPQNLAATGRGPESSLLTWDDSGTVGDKYAIQYTTDPTAYEDNAVGNISQEEYELEEAATSHRYSLTGLEAGALYYVRVRKLSGDLAGAWTDVVEAQQQPNPDDEDALAAPTVATTQAVLPTDQETTFAWIHSGVTEQTQAEVAFTVTDQGGATFTQVYEVEGTDEEIVKTPEEIGMADGYTADWRVRTMGLINGYWSPWSTVQRFTAYAQPVATAGLADGEGNQIGGDAPLEVMPLNVSVSADAASAGNEVIAFGFRLEVAEGFEAEAMDGTVRYWSQGEEVFSKSIDANSDGFDPTLWEFQVGAGEVQLYTGASYMAVAEAVTAAGMRADTEPTVFTVHWGGQMPQPSVRVEYDSDAMTCEVFPYCNVADASQYSDVWVEPDGFTASAGSTCTRAMDNGDGTATLLVEPDGEYVSVFVGAEEIPVDEGGTAQIVLAYGEDTEAVWSSDSVEETAVETLRVEGVLTPAPEDDEEEEEPEPHDTSLTPEEIAALAELGDSDMPDMSVNEQNQYPDPDDLMPPVDASGETLRENTVLDVYRIQSDGSAVLIASGLPNDGSTGTVDPHPNFATCTYRVVARDTETTLAASVEASIDIPMKQAVIQWNEQWEEDGTYAGERLVTPYGVKVQESYEVESVLRAYAGRRSPVSYYGTQLAHEESIETSFVRYLDGQELAAARRLAAWFGDCYVREPSGTGFWASAKVSIGHEHNTDKQNVTFSLTRVEGGA